MQKLRSEENLLQGKWPTSYVRAVQLNDIAVARCARCRLSSSSVGQLLRGSTAPRRAVSCPVVGARMQSDNFPVTLRHPAETSHQQALDSRIHRLTL